MADILGGLGIGGMQGAIVGWMSTGVFWVGVCIVLIFSLSIFLFVRKRQKLKYMVYEIVPFGNGKIGINISTAGMFKSKSALGGLWDYGTDYKFKTKDNRIILEATTRDLHDLNGKKGFIVTRKPDDPKILVPLTKFKIENSNLLSEIAPADFRDASVGIIVEASKETQGMLDKYLPYIMLGTIIIFFVIAMLVATQFFNRTIDKSGEILSKVSANCGVPAGGNAP